MPASTCRPLVATVSADYPDYRLTSLAPTDKAPATGGELLPKGSLSVSHITAGRLLVTTGVGTFGLFDRSGHPLSAGLSGYVRYLDDGLLVAASGSDDVGFEVYSIG